ncbi:MAG: CorA family divalent cation transporter [Vampirovibrionales bacterium]
MSESPILFAYELSETGGRNLLEGDELEQAFAENRPIWVHLQTMHPDAKPWLQDHLAHENSLAWRSLLRAKTRPHAEVLGCGLLLVLRAANLNPESNRADMVSLRIWIQSNTVITLERRPVKAIRDMAHHLENGTGPKNLLAFLPFLIDCILNNLEPVLTALDADTNHMEEHLLDFSTSTAMAKVPDLRKQTLLFRRNLSAERDAMKTLLQLDYFLVQDIRTKKALKEQLHRITHFIEDLEMMQERSQIVQDELRHRLNDRINKSNLWLSVVATVSIPLMFITGLWGMNFTHIPFSDDPNGFWWAALLALVLGGLSFALIYSINHRRNL